MTVSTRSNCSPSRSGQSHCVVGYTAGVFDLFHVGHLNVLRNASARCDYLIAGVTTDSLAETVKGAPPVMPLVERMSIVQSVRHVDLVVVQASLDKLVAWRALRFDMLFVGDNMRGSPDWDTLASRMAGVGVCVSFLPATYTAAGELLSRGPEDLVAE